MEISNYEKLLSQGLKACTKCGEIKALEDFSKRLKIKYRSTCKYCDSELNKIYETNNRQQINHKRRERRKDPIRNLLINQRDSQRRLFRNNFKNFNSTSLCKEKLGCTLEELKFFVESNFKEGMTWENRGIGLDKWQLDHIIPISLTQVVDGIILDNSFNNKIWHYTNLQPLWHSENARKSNKCDNYRTIE